MTSTTEQDAAPTPSDFVFTVPARFTFTVPAEEREAGYAFPPAEVQLTELRSIFDADDVDVLTNLSALIGAMSAVGVRPIVALGEITGHTAEIAP